MTTELVLSAGLLILSLAFCLQLVHAYRMSTTIWLLSNRIEALEQEDRVLAWLNDPDTNPQGRFPLR